MTVRCRILLGLWMLGATMQAGCVGMSRPFPLTRRAARPLVEQHWPKSLAPASLAQRHGSDPERHLATAFANPSHELWLDVDR